MRGRICLAIKAQSRIISFFGIMLLGGAVTAEAPDAKYEVEFYSFEGDNRRGDEAHTFARFTKIAGDGSRHHIDISWMPVESELVQPGNRMPYFKVVQGKNYSWEETKKIALKKPIEIRGKFSISAEVFEKAAKRKRALEKMRYKRAIEGVRDSEVTNCIHAVSGVLGDFQTGIKFGRSATDAVIGFFKESGALGERLPSENPPPATNRRTSERGGLEETHNTNDPVTIRKK